MVASVLPVATGTGSVFGLLVITSIPIVPDPWNATPGRALSVVKDGLESLTDGLSEYEVVRVQVEVVQSRRVYMPTYVIKYYILGME